MRKGLLPLLLLGACHPQVDRTTPRVDTPPLPTPELMRQLGGEVPFERLIDPATGLLDVSVPGEGGAPVIEHVCGKDLVARALALGVKLRFMLDEVEPPQLECAGLSCTFINDYIRLYDQLVFRTTDHGVVARAFVTYDHKIDAAVLAALLAKLPAPEPCQAAGIVPVPEPARPGPPRERREEPKGDLNPTVVTDALLERLGSGAWPLARFVDRQRGLVYGDAVKGPGDDQPPPRGPQGHLCGAALDQALPQIEKEVRAKIAESGKASGRCWEEPGFAECRGGRGWDPTYRLHFRIDPERGLQLESVTVDEQPGGSSAARFAGALQREQLLRKYRAEPCAR